MDDKVIDLAIDDIGLIYKKKTNTTGDIVYTFEEFPGVLCNKDGKSVIFYHLKLTRTVTQLVLETVGHIYDPARYCAYILRFDHIMKEYSNARC